MTKRTCRLFSATLCCAVMVTALASCGQGGAPSSGTTAGQVLPAGGESDGLVIAFGSEPTPPAVGDNTIRVTVKRADGSPLTDGTVTATFSMPAMPSMNMPAMRAEAPLRHEGEGQYRGTGQLSMSGTWNVAITVASGGNTLATRRTSVVAKE